MAKSPKIMLIRHAEGIALIAWQHEEIPAIGEAILGSKPGTLPKWPGDRFDLVWVFDLDKSGSYKFSQVPQMLLAGDTSSVIPVPTQPSLGS